MKAAFQAADPQPLEATRMRRSRHHPRAGRILSVSLLLVLSWAGTLLFIGGALAIWRTGESQGGWIALSGLLLFVLGRGTAFILGRHLNCTLCHGPVLHEKRCHKHAEALRIRPFSYRSSTVLSLLSCGNFRCMYCGTPFRLKK